MPSFADSIFLFVLALLLFGPKKLPVLARELGKWMGEFRRASNEFKMQMEDELRVSEQADRQKRIAAMEAAAPVPPPLDEPVHPHLARAAALPAEAATQASPDPAIAAFMAGQVETTGSLIASGSGATETHDALRPLPIAVSGDLHMMPPATGLPIGRRRNGDPLSHALGDPMGDPMGGLLESIPEAGHSSDSPAAAAPPFTPENAVHGD